MAFRRRKRHDPCQFDATCIGVGDWLVYRNDGTYVGVYCWQHADEVMDQYRVGYNEPISIDPQQLQQLPNES